MAVQSVDSALDGQDTRTVQLDDPSEPRASQAAAAVTVGERIGRYVVRERIGAGGMGIVYAAHDEELDRDVAIKLLWPGRDSESVRARLIREARALALVSHPNVVEVYDVGVTDERVFMSMELIDGEPLSQWLKTPRPWPAVLPVLLQAGRGLAAAHAAELLHRDFKPDNVLVGRDGRVRVTDFGLAKAMRDDGSSSSSAIMVRGTQSLAVTRAGTNPGTPRYMAPEQHRGETVDAAADQFAYCVALYEAICRESPFKGRNMDDLRRQKEQGVAEPKWPADLPRRIGRAIERGLSPRPVDRWPSVDDLLTVLERPRRSRERLLLWGAAGLVAVTASVAALLPSNDRRCGDRPLSKAWNEEARDRVGASFRATELSYADQAWTRLSSHLDGYAREWEGLYAATCEQLRDVGAEAQRAADARMACLEVARVEFQSLMGVLLDADAKTVEQAPRLVDGLTPMPTCKAAGADHDGPPLPPTPEAQREVTEIRELISQAKTLELAGHADAARSPLDKAVDRAEALGFAPVLAEALTTLGSLDETTGEYERAASRLQRATLMADEAGYDLVAAKSALRLTFVLGERLARREEALRWERFARAALDRSGNDPVLETQLETYRLAILGERDDFEHYAAALRGRIEQLEADDREPGLRAAALTALGNAAFRAGRLDESRDSFERALQLGVRVWGDRHPRTALYYNNLGSVIATQGESKRARELFEQALVVWKEGFGEDHPEVARAHHNLGVLLTDANVSAEAIEHFERALELRRARQGPEHPEVADTLHALAGAHRDLGHHDEAERLYLEALRVFEQTPTSMPSQRAAPLVGLGMLALDTEDFAAATSAFRRALEITDADPNQLAEAHFGLAVVDATQDVIDQDTRDAAATALRLMQEAGPRHAPRMKEMNAWLAEHDVDVRKPENVEVTDSPAG